MRRLIPIILIMGLVFLAGCQNNVSQDNIDKSFFSNVSSTQHEQVEIVEADNNEKNISVSISSNNTEDEKKHETLKEDSIEATPAPTEELNEEIEIEEKVCPEDCDDDNACTKDSCSESTDYECKQEDITPCANNGICEQEEFSGVVSPFCPGEAHAVSTSQIESKDCPKTCDDNNPNTGDWYNFDSQKCEHNKCGYDEVDEATYNVSNVLVSIQFYHVEDIGIGEYITIKNHREETVVISTGCNYPISPYASGSCLGWSLRAYEDYPSFTYKYVEPNSEVKGWVWGVSEDFLVPYDTNKFRSTIRVDGKEISFDKTLDDINFW